MEMTEKAARDEVREIERSGGNMVRFSEDDRLWLRNWSRADLHWLNVTSVQAGGRTVVDREAWCWRSLSQQLLYADIPDMKSWAVRGVKMPDWELIGQGMGSDWSDARVDAWVWRRTGVPVPEGGVPFGRYAVTTHEEWDYYSPGGEKGEPAPIRPARSIGAGHETLGEAANAAIHTECDPEAARSAVEAARQEAEKYETAERATARIAKLVRGDPTPTRSECEDHGHSH